MALQERRLSGLFLTLKIVQLIHCLKSRVSVVPAKIKRLGPKTRIGLGSRAPRSIAKDSTRTVSPLTRKQLHNCALPDRICKSRKIARANASLKLHESGRTGSVELNSVGEDVQVALRALDLHGNISPPGKAMSAVCADDSRFLQQDVINLDGCSLNQTVRSLLLVSEAISVLYAARLQYNDACIIAQCADLGLGIDESFIANYEHLLLRLQSELINGLSRKVDEALLENNLDKTQRKLLHWFSEFPDNQHPLGTTWPWAIKPSLAVLWGVCWMFYNNDSKNSVPQDRLFQAGADQFRGWHVPRPDDCKCVSGIASEADCFYGPRSWEHQADRNYGLELIGTQPQPRAPQGAMGGEVGMSSMGGDDRLYSLPDLSVQARVRQPSRATQPLPWSPSDLLGGGFSGRTLGVSRPTYYNENILPTALDQYNISLAENQGIATSTNLVAFPQHQFELNSEAWPQQYAHSLPHQHHQHSSHLTVPSFVPGIRVSEEVDAYAQPLSQYDSIYPGPSQPLNLNTNVPTFMMGAESSPIHSAHSDPGFRHGHARASSIHSIANSTIMTPVSMSGGQSPIPSPRLDRRPSVHSPVASSRHPSPSEDSNSQDDEDGSLSPRKLTGTHKRPEDPPRNAQGKMICRYSGCGDQTFDRKCEWSKHMDKHDRPYKCTVKGCEKLQGFTYSGGLLRHEREVHKMHGGTKKSLYCPFADCKRSSGSGFTRKENLAEHVRRVHRRTSASSDLGQLVVHPESREERPKPQAPPELPYHHRHADVHDEDRKRKRIPIHEVTEPTESTDLHSEVKRLRRENEEKDARLQILERAVSALQQQGRK